MKVSKKCVHLFPVSIFCNTTELDKNKTMRYQYPSSFTGARLRAKRKAGVNPARTRRCNLVPCFVSRGNPFSRRCHCRSCDGKAAGRAGKPEGLPVKTSGGEGKSPGPRVMSLGFGGFLLWIKTRQASFFGTAQKGEVKWKNY